MFDLVLNTSLSRPVEKPQGGFWKSKIKKQKRLLKKQSEN